MAGRGRPKNPPRPKKLLKEVLPFEDIFTEDELPMYRDLVDLYMQDFDQDDLSSSDIDDIMDLAKNRVLEFRLLKSSKDSKDGDRLVDISAAVEKIKKENKVLKENLSTRRRDRINPNEFKGFSIVDLAVAYDANKKEKLAEQIRHNRKEEVEVVESRKDYLGNRYDSDAKQLGHEDDETR
jgi:hypothetical protein